MRQFLTRSHVLCFLLVVGLAFPISAEAKRVSKKDIQNLEAALAALDYDTAAEICVALQEQSAPEKYDALRRQRCAGVMAMRGWFDQAEEALEGIDPESDLGLTSVQNTRGNIAYMQCDYEAARRHYALADVNATEMGREPSVYKGNLANVLIVQGHYTVAEQSLASLLERWPDHPYADVWRLNRIWSLYLEDRDRLTESGDGKALEKATGTKRLMLIRMGKYWTTATSAVNALSPESREFALTYLDDLEARSFDSVTPAQDALELDMWVTFGGVFDLPEDRIENLGLRRNALLMSVIEGEGTCHDVHLSWFDRRAIELGLKEDPVEVAARERAKAEAWRAEVKKRRSGRRANLRADQLPARTLMLAADPLRPDQLYLLDSNHTLWSSRDGGERWTEAVHDSESLVIEAFVPSSAGQLLGLAEDGRLMLSENAGESWVPVQGLPEAAVTALAADGSVPLMAVDPENAERFLMAVDGQLYLTEDGGKAFETVATPGEVLALALDPVDGSMLFAMVEGQGLMKHAGKGKWELLLDTAADPDSLTVLRSAQASGEVLLALADGSMLLASDGGETFLPLADEVDWMAEESLLAVARDPVDMALMMVTSEGRVFRRAAGSGWEPVGTVSELGALAEDGLSYLSMGENELRIGLAQGMATLDLAPMLDPARARAGATRVFTPGQALPHVLALGVDPANPDRLFAIGEGGKAWVSDNGGRRFDELKAPKGEAWIAMATTSALGGEPYLASASGVWAWQGKKFEPVDLPGSGQVLDVAADADGAWVLRDASLVRLEAGAEAWDIPLPGSVAQLSLAGGGEPWLADAQGQVWRWAGADWKSTRAPAPEGGAFVALVTDSSTQGRAFVAHDNGLFRFDPGREAWIGLADDRLSGEEAPSVLALAVDPSDRSLYLSLSDGCILRSINGGDTWRSVDDGLPMAVASLVAQGGSVYLAQAGEFGQLYRLSKVLSRQRLSSKVFFETGSARLAEDGLAALDPLATELKDGQGEIRIEGHTDNVGKDDVNERLSLERAESVAEFFADQGIDEERLSTEGFGARRPVADNETDDGKAQNRRVEILVVD